MKSKPIYERIQKTVNELEVLQLELHNSPVADMPPGMQAGLPVPVAVPLPSIPEPAPGLPPTQAPSKTLSFWKHLVSRGKALLSRISPSRVVLILYLEAITLSEMLTTLLYPTAGVICHALVLVGLFLHGALTHKRSYRRMLVTLSLAPLIRIVSLALPLQDYIFYFWYLLVGAPLFLSAFLVARYVGFRPADIGLRLNGWPMQLLLGFGGIGLGYIEYLILRPAPLVNALTLEQVWLPGLILIVFTGLLEEIIFRGLMQKAFIDGLGKTAGLLFVSIIFAVLHLGYHSALDVVFVFAVALLFGYVALRSRSIIGVTLAHGLTNFCLFLVFPFLLA